ncbi:MAG: hypothetical protein A2Y62_00940 [Candidatus Fischerbacteria bacterium RBG_13_37_8]|uniref:Fibronectin type-III domain-containing protein n=1 Tax=Candidatus Fischerbacteria bacterium RBG_13_37_8 TaxID=1817863 RepID=A0A1F5VVT7_9BACT|nr:MAG: hypothetical protein A2Y62_00940 [Candidatus Fischerbacteria bacterium RBG_13_37_8]
MIKGVLNSILVLIYFCIFSMNGFSSTWEGIYGGSGNELGYDIIRAWDGGYVVVGMSSSFNGIYYDLWLLRLGEDGIIQWQNRYDSVFNEGAYSIAKTSDGGYAIVGFVDVLSSLDDYWIVKLSGNFQIQWQKAMGKKGSERAYSVISTSDGGFIAVGYTDTYGIGITDIWVTKFNVIGQFLSYKTYGGSGNDIGHSVIETSEGGYLVAGATESAGYGMFDIILLKLDTEYNIEWQKTYGSIGEEWAYSIIATEDGGYVLCGYGADDNISQRDTLVIKVNSVGIVEWARNYYTEYDETAYKIIERESGGYLVTGYISEAGNEDDILLISLDPSGNVEWQKRYGGFWYDRAMSIVEENNGSNYMLVGFSGSYGSGGYDVWVMKLDGNGEVGGDCIASVSTNLMIRDADIIATDSTMAVEIPLLDSSFTQVAPILTNVNSDVCLNAGGAGAVPDNDNYAGNPLAIEKGGANLLLSWDVPGGTCVTDDYSIYRGSLPFSNYDHMLLLCSTLGQTNATIVADTDSYYYLVVAQYQDTEGSYGLDSNDIQRPAAQSQCFPQQISNCN